MVRDRYQGHEAAQVMATLGAAMAVIPLAAPTVGAWLLVWINWRATFVALGVFALVVLSGLRLFEESAPPPEEKRLSVSAIISGFGIFLTDRRFIGYQIVGTATFCALFTFLSTVSFFMRDVFQVAPKNFGYAFAISVSGYMVGSLSSARLVPFFGPDNTMRGGTVLSTLMAAVLVFAALQDPVPPLLAAFASFLLFLGIGLTFANASMGAVSLYPRRAGAASAAYGFTHATTASVVGVVAAQIYDGTLLPTTSIMLTSCLLACAGLYMAREVPTALEG
jgi:DHA1 family bicyclomycin/chloramphenicol resistance-like MFS transporter